MHRRHPALALALVLTLHWHCTALHLTTYCCIWPSQLNTPNFQTSKHPASRRLPIRFCAAQWAFLCYVDGSVRPRNAIAARLCPLMTDTSYRILAPSLFCVGLLLTEKKACTKVQVLFCQAPINHMLLVYIDRLFFPRQKSDSASKSRRLFLKR